MIEDMYDIAVSNGIDQQAFWHMTLGEIKQYIKACADNRKAEFKQQLLLREFQAIRTAEYVACIFSSDASAGSYYDKFPELFKEEVQTKIDGELRANIQRAKGFADYHNKEYVEPKGGEIKNGNDIGTIRSRD